MRTNAVSEHSGGVSTEDVDGGIDDEEIDRLVQEDAVLVAIERFKIATERGARFDYVSPSYYGEGIAIM